MADYCLACSTFEKGKTHTGECKNPKLKWIIDLKLAAEQALCDDVVTGEIETVAILTPLGQKALISKSAYDAEKNIENYWTPIVE